MNFTRCFIVSRFYFLILFKLLYTQGLFITYDNFYESHFKNVQNYTNLTFCRTRTLRSLHNVVLLAFDKNESILSFTHSYEYLDNSETDHYGFSTSLRELRNHISNEEISSCLRYTDIYFQTLRLSLISISMKNIAVITDSSDCSIKLMVRVKASFTELTFYHFSISAHSGAQEKLYDYLYRLKTTGVSLIVVLTTETLYSTIFELASWYDLTSRKVTWLIPYFQINTQLENIPIELLTFDDLSRNSYVNITDLVVNLQHVFNEFHDICYSNLLNNNIHMCVAKKLYNLLLHDKRTSFEVSFRYRNVYLLPDGWTVVQADIDGEKLILKDSSIPILKSLSGSNSHDHIRAVVQLEEPYVTLNQALYDHDDDICTAGLKCTDKNETTCCIGFSIDIFKGIMEDLNLDFKMHVVKDGLWGSLEKGKWNGLVGEIMRNEADIAVAPLTITKERYGVIDFTTSYSVEHIGILVIPKVKELELLNWEFIAPLHAELQIALWIVALVAILFLFVCENSVYGANIIFTGKTKEKYFGIIESMTYISGMFLQRDVGGKSPTRLGAKVLSLLYAFAMVIFVTTYTAKLAAQSVQNIIDKPFTGSEDPRMRFPTLEFKYGVINKSTSFETFFKNGETEKVKTMYHFMKENNFMYNSITDGLKMLNSRKLDAIIGDYQTLLYRLSKDQICNASLAKDSLYHAGRAFGIKKNFHLKTAFDAAILKYKENDVIKRLTKKWSSKLCPQNLLITEKKQVEILQFSGLIFVLGITIIFSFLLLMPEFLYYKYMHVSLCVWLKKTLLRTEKFNIDTDTKLQLAR